MQFKHASAEFVLKENQPLAAVHARGVLIRCTEGRIWITVSGHPGLTVPAGFACDAQGEPMLPVGLQLVGGFDRDEALLDVGERVEAMLAPLNAVRPAPAVRR